MGVDGGGAKGDGGGVSWRQDDGVGRIGGGDSGIDDLHASGLCSGGTLRVRCVGCLCVQLAARIAVSNLQKNTIKSFTET